MVSLPSEGSLSFIEPAEVLILLVPIRHVVEFDPHVPDGGPGHFHSEVHEGQQREHHQSEFEPGNAVLQVVLAGHEVAELSDVVGHLGRGGRGSVVVFQHPVVERPGHADDHMFEEGVELLALWHVDSEGGLVVVARHYVVDVGRTAWLRNPDSAQVGGVQTTVR